MIRDSSRHPDAAGSALVFVVALAFYGVTLAPTVIWGDSAALALEARAGSPRLATAGDHPLFVLVAHLFAKLPGELARNVNFVAALFGALAVMLVYRCARRLQASRFAAGLGAAALCVSHTFWLHSVVAEVYTANAFFLAATLNLLLEWQHSRRWWWLAAATATFVVGLTNHLVLATLAPAAFAFVVVTGGRALVTRRVLLCCAAVLAAAIAWAVVRPEPAAIARTLWYGPPGISDYLGLDFAPKATAREAGYYLLYLVYQFPSASLLLGALGAWVLVRRQAPVAVLLLLTIAVNAAVFIRHTVWPSAGNAKYVFYIPDYVVFSIVVAVGANEVMRRIGPWPASRRTVAAIGLLLTVVVVPPVVYAVAPSAAHIAGLDLLHARSLPYRNNERFFLNPNKHGENGARRFGEEALQQMKPGAVIFADYTPYMVLRYLMVIEGRRPDVMLAGPRSVSETANVRWIFDGQRRRPTYLATLTPGYYDLTGLTGEYDLVPAGPILEVCPR